MADLVINLAARSWKECSERIFSGAPTYGDTATRVSGPWLVAGIEWFRPRLGGCVDLLLLYAVTSITIVVTSKTIYLFLF